MSERKLRQIFDKTEGHCHFCGDKVVFEKRGWVEGDLSGYWEVDHVIQRDKGGADSVDNCLPACTECNRLRWHRKGAEVRELLFLGLIARKQIKDTTAIGKQLEVLKEKRLKQNMARRKSAKEATGLETQVSLPNDASSNSNAAQDGLEDSETE